MINAVRVQSLFLKGNNQKAKAFPVINSNNKPNDINFSKCFRNEYNVFALLKFI